jgi:hypothetical protein
VTYKPEGTTCLRLEIPREAGTNAAEVEAYKERAAARLQLKESGASDAAAGQVGGGL